MQGLIARHAVEQVPVGHHALQPVGRADRRRTHVKLPHQDRGILGEGIGIDELHIPGHRLGNSQACTPFRQRTSGLCPTR